MRALRTVSAVIGLTYLAGIWRAVRIVARASDVDTITAGRVLARYIWAREVKHLPGPDAAAYANGAARHALKVAR